MKLYKIELEVVFKDYYTCEQIIDFVRNVFGIPIKYLMVGEIKKDDL